jgi:hypothetical protein
MKLLAPPRWLPLLSMVALLAVLPTDAFAASYRIFWNVTRASDNAPLLAVSTPAEANRTSVLRTDSTTPQENRPALPLLTASFSPMKERAGVFELKVLARVREVTRNKKGKLKRSKRNIGALLPVRLGESQTVSAEGDPIRLEARVEAAR